MINKIINFSVTNKLITGVLLAIFVMFGIYSFTQLSVDALPDVTNNQVQVITNAPNLATQEVEQFITYPLETEFKSLSDMVELRSTSRSGLSVITIVFKDNVAVNIARQRVDEKIKTATDNIPKQYGTPELLPPTTGLGEIFQYVLVPQKGYEEKYDLSELRTIQDWIVRRQLLGTVGVVDVSSFGGKLKQYEVSVKPERLSANNLTLIEVFDALQNNNENTGGSYIDKGPNVYFIRGEGLIQNLDDINNIVVKNNSGVPILIKDIAEVKFGFAPRYGAMTRNGKGETVGGIVLMQKGENAVRVIERVKERMKSIEKSLPQGVKLDVFIDRTKLIEKTVSTVSTNLLEGALIVILVLVLFLGSLRAGLIVASVIPLAMLFAIIIMNMFGLSANLMSMGALDFGLIVDGAVIVVEATLHIFSKHYKNNHLTQNQLDKEVIKSSSKIMSSAIFGQIIILIVYIPLFVLRGIEGKMFMPMAQTVSFAIVGALILSLTYVPWASSLFLSKKISDKPNFTDRFINKLNNWYQPYLVKALERKFAVIGVAIFLFITSLFIFNSLGGEFIPELDEGDFAIEATLRQGTSLPQTVETFTLVEKILKQFPEVIEVVSKIGSSEIPTDPMPINNGDIIVVLKDRKEWTSANNNEELAEKMNEKLSVIPGCNLSFEQPIQMRFSELIAGVKSDIAIKIFGDDLDKLFSEANKAVPMLKKIKGLTDIKVEQVSGMPQLVVKYNRNKIAQYGLNIADVNRILNTAYAGGTTGVVYEGERKFDLVVRIPKSENTDIDALKSLLIPTPKGNQIPLNEVAEITFKTAPSQISREDAQRRIVIEANVRGRDVESVVLEIQQKLDAKLKLPEGYFINYGGQFQNLQEAKGRLQLAVPVALLLIFFLLFLSFRSLKEATIIFSAIPLASIGGIIALWVRGMNFSISAGVGFIALFGVAVLNGIVLISYYNQLKDEGEDNLLQRIYKGSSARLRPILATATVASLGFLPMALSTSAGAEVQKPLATVVIGGLLTSTLLTLFVLPVLYYLVMTPKNIKVNPKIATIVVLFFSCFSFNANAQSQDLTLQNALDLATKNYPTIQQATLQTEQQQTLTKTATVLDPFNINSNLGQINSKLFDYNIGVAQGFKLSNKAERNLLNQNVAVAKSFEGVTKNELIKNVSNAYFFWLYNVQHYNLLLETDNIFADYEKYADKKFQVGETSKLEKVNASLQRKELKMQLAEANSQVAFYVAELQKWTRSNTAYQAPKKYEALPEINVSDSTLVKDHPVLQFLQQQIIAKELAIKSEKAKANPSFNLGVNAQSLDKENPFYYGSVGINIPLFRNGIKAKTQVARLETEIAKKELDKSQQELSTLFLQQFQLQKQYSEQLNFYKTEGLPMAETIVNSAQRLYKSGDIGYIEYTQNLKDANKIKTDYLIAMNNYNQTIINIQYLLNK
ncbi:CusA/CzcA family heavy metal efflux RND transporter [Flavobacterium sp. GT3R68]|uniref:CusA/CzcA family heavy metal efflux RND transporter n=1 Tax=Flavobacterium sp. GT3R68 TaxID=2594437 RepID=UPI000F8830A5|nr:CusA/CzcA family heavy metal efflux RND transporter [Flavobacterium sp. GT3R68]RTY90597.1 CusA/CzcA family heavy metal efflux RND transporter [Flavobacterium sp. GSN2]TRW89877.1 CusA/CzcA family heavy metal efflux RND transporter [Flavobacterium sp. GT3R68]